MMGLTFDKYRKAQIVKQDNLIEFPKHLNYLSLEGMFNYLKESEKLTIEIKSEVRKKFDYGHNNQTRTEGITGIVTSIETSSVANFSVKEDKRELSMRYTAISFGTIPEIPLELQTPAIEIFRKGIEDYFKSN